MANFLEWEEIKGSSNKRLNVEFQRNGSQVYIGNARNIKSDKEGRAVFKEFFIKLGCEFIGETHGPNSQYDQIFKYYDESFLVDPELRTSFEEHNNFNTMRGPIRKFKNKSEIYAQLGKNKDCAYLIYLKLLMIGVAEPFSWKDPEPFVGIPNIWEGYTNEHQFHNIHAMPPIPLIVSNIESSWFSSVFSRTKKVTMYEINKYLDWQKKLFYFCVTDQEYQNYCDFLESTEYAKIAQEKKVEAINEWAKTNNFKQLSLDQYKKFLNHELQTNELPSNPF